MSAYAQLLGPNGLPLRNGHRSPEELKRTGFALAQVSTFSGIVDGVSKSYRWAFDEALRNSPTNALAMRRDGTVMALLRERQMPSAQAKWHLEPEDQKDKTQVAVCDALTQMVESIPRFNRLRLSLLEAVWFGRYGVQYAIGRRKIKGQTRYTVFNHQPVHGDKFIFRWDGTPGVLISQLYAKTYEDGPSSLVGITDPYVKQLKESGGVVLPTTRGIALFLETPAWRERFAIHMHEQEDADFQEPELAGGLFGVGLRHRCYWLWWLRQEVLAWMMDYLARVGAGGLTLIGYDASNPSGKDEAIEIGQQLQNGNVIVVPRPLGTDKPTSVVERIEPSQGGTQMLLTIVNEFFDGWMERLFVGQSMSGGADDSSGLGGSGRAKFAQDTKHQLISMDCTALDECITEQLVQPLKRWNFPGADFQVRFVTDLDTPDPKAALEAVVRAAGIGVDFIKNEVRELTGLSEPGPDDETVGGQQQGAPGQPGPQGDPQATSMLQGAADSGQLFDHDGLSDMESQLGGTGPNGDSGNNGPMQYAKPFEERLHPRKQDGKFASKGEPKQQKLWNDPEQDYKDQLKKPPPTASRARLMDYWDKMLYYKLFVDTSGDSIPLDKTGKIKASAEKVIGSWTDKAVREFTQNIDELHIYPTMDDLTDSDPELRRMLGSGPNAKVGGFYKVQRDVENGTRSMNIDGGRDTGESWGNSGEGTTESIYAHEFMHAVDGAGEQFSHTARWYEVAGEEINRPSNPLSKYARSSPAEAFAEFGRLIYDKGRKYAKENFPKCYGYFEEQGLV
jgi:hypothetical protein